MTNVLKDILARKRIEVAKAKMITPQTTLERVVAQIEPPRNFFRAVVDGQARKQTRIIAEIKRKSPSAGIIREDFDPVRIAKQYAEAGAAAISCLTDEYFFGGHLGYVQQIKAAVSLPVLRKDFVVDEYQIWEARAANADAVLLIAEVLPEGEMLDMMILAQRLGMTTLVEAHDVEHAAPGAAPHRVSPRRLFAPGHQQSQSRDHGDRPRPHLPHPGPHRTQAGSGLRVRNHRSPKISRGCGSKACTSC